MSNMSYCRFRNTLSDLQDCRDNLEDEMSDPEKRARAALIKVCREIVGMADADETLEQAPKRKPDDYD